jgi:tetratricopeptide (TPR) repeat protein
VKTLGFVLLPIAVACTAPQRSGPATTAPAEPPAFVEDDYPRALGDARTRRLPLVIDAWAPWCHTCLSLKNYVFPDPALRPLADHFVWLSLDTEREVNAPLVSRLGVHALPTLYVLDAATEQPVLAWTGSLTASELASLLADAETSVRQRGTEGQAAASLLRGHRASAEGKLTEAVAEYRRALSLAPDGWSKRAQVVDALVSRLSDSKDYRACVDTAADEAPRMPPGTFVADVLRAALGCAREAPNRDAQRPALVRLIALGQRVASDPAQSILADDRSDLYDYLIDAVRTLGQDDDVGRLAAAWSVFLETEAARAPTPAARAVFDAHRLLAYKALGQPQRALPMLEQSERDFPGDYNPPARLAVAYLALSRYDEALAAVKRALDRAYGPRRLRLWSLEADIDEAKGDSASAREALRAALSFAKTVPLTAGYEQLREAIARRLDEMR